LLSFEGFWVVLVDWEHLVWWGFGSFAMATAGAMSTMVSSGGLQSTSLTRGVRRVSAAVQRRPCVLSRSVDRSFNGGVNGATSVRSSLLRRGLFGASLKGLVEKNLVRAAAEVPEAVTYVLEEAAPEQLVETIESLPSKIWMSDVVVRKRRNYFKNRQWTAKDLTYAGFMTLMHGLCMFSPATFSWNAFVVFVGLYVITGLLGITLSYHRNLSHKSFKVPKWLEYAFAYCGVQAIQVTMWTAYLPNIAEVKVAVLLYDVKLVDYGIFQWNSWSISIGLCNLKVLLVNLC
jgi:hypothetical protein